MTRIKQKRTEGIQKRISFSRIAEITLRYSEKLVVDFF